MPADLIVEHIVIDAAKFDEYRTRVAPMIAKHGGRYLTREPRTGFRKAATGGPSAS